ncbi:MAG: hypothetical protein AAGK74_01810 [Chloroflexota bacterium]
MAIFLLIARFYQRFSGRQTRYWWFALPILLYGVASVRYASIQVLTGDLVGDVFSAAGGIALAVITTLLYYQMMRQPPS